MEQPTSQPAATAEQSGSTADRAPASAPASTTTEDRPKLASLADALTASAAKPAAASNRGTKADKPPAPDPRHSADEASKPEGSQQSPGTDPAPTTLPDPAHTADEATQPGESGKDGDGKGSQDERPSRRGALQIKELTTERDALRAEVEALRASVAVPDHIAQAAVAVRLTDAEFSRLDEKKRREGITGEYLSADEEESYNKALQVREWSAPWYADAQQQAVAWAEQQRAALAQSAANDLAPVIRARPYLSNEAIGRASSWQAIYDHLCDAAEAHGASKKAAELQPKLDEALGRVHDLEAELTGRRHADVGRGRSFERGGSSGGAYVPRPDFKSAKASDLFLAAEEDAARRRNGRAAAGAR